MALNPKDYPDDWKLRSKFVRFYRAKGLCEWCGAEHLKPHPITGSKVVLTTAHIYDRDKKNGSLLNLAALCQRCHLEHDKEQHSQTRRRNKAKKLYGENGERISNTTQFVHWCVLNSDKPQEQIAREMGLRPSTLSRKLSESGGDGMVFTADDFETYLECQDDFSPLLYMLHKFCGAEGLDRLTAQLSEGK